jgi:hypothetical protein
MEVVDSDFGRYPRGRVATYRAYRIDDASRISETAIVFEAPDDVTATARARALLGDRDKFEIRGGVAASCDRYACSPRRCGGPPTL